MRVYSAIAKLLFGFQPIAVGVTGETLFDTAAVVEIGSAGDGIEWRTGGGFRGFFGNFGSGGCFLGNGLFGGLFRGWGGFLLRRSGGYFFGLFRRHDSESVEVESARGVPGAEISPNSCDCQHVHLAYHLFVSDGYSWRDVRGEETYRLPGPEHIGWWAAAAMLVSVLLHVLVFFALDHMKIALRFKEARELSTQSVDVRQVEIRPMEEEQSLTPENLVVPPTDAASLLEEVDLLDMLPKDQEIDIKPDILEAEYALKMQNPAISGDPEAIALEAATGLEVDAELPDFGRELTELKPAEVGQVTVDPGAVMADDLDLSKFTDNLTKIGAAGKVDKGALDGITSLDDLIDLPPNTLVGKTTMLPSDLLFEFNSAELRESAKVGLMKLGLLIDRNPTLYCWIEGHTDLIGGDDFNLELSRKRAAAVRSYLVDSLKMDGEKIITRGFGRAKPIIPDGTADEQMPNRRVEIRMRKTPPPPEPIKVTPKITPPPPPVEETPPKAVLVKPNRPLPIEEPPVAQPVPEPPAPRAQPVEEVPPRAVPIEPEILRAETVEE